MKSIVVAAGFVALGLLAASASAQEQKEVPADPQQEQQVQPGQPPAPEAPAAESPAALPPEVIALLGDSRPASELSVEELKARFSQARQFSRLEGVSPEVQRQLSAMAKDARGELAAREQQAQPAEPPAKSQEQPAANVGEPTQKPGSVQQPAPQPEIAVEPAPQGNQRSSGEGMGANGGGVIPPALVEILRDKRPASALDAKQLERRITRIRKFETIDGLPPNAAARLAVMKLEAEQEWAQRQQAQGQSAPQPPEQPSNPPVAETTAPQQPGLAEVLNDARSASALDIKQLERRITRIRQLEAEGDLPPDLAARLAVMKLEAEQEWAQRQQAQGSQQAGQPGAPPPPPKPPVAQAPVPQPAPGAPPPQQADSHDVQQLDANEVDPRVEARARDLLSDGRADRMNDEELRQRLDDMRQVLATNSLSRETERELRRRVSLEREILRNRVAAAEADRLRQAQRKQRPQNRYWAEEAPSDWEWSARDILNDRRRSEDLRTYELRRRLEVYRQAVADKRYAPEFRDYWRAVIARDQYVLQLRLVDLRRKRQAQIDDIYGNDELDFEIGSGRTPSEDVFAAEVDDEQLQDVLIAKPRRKFNRRFTIEEIEQNPQVRAALPRVEVDTVKFGFNEAFVRPEEIDKLDRIGEILERILRKNPNEIFLIEGHTDAVGSDAANLALSRKRAEAVKKALTTYYIIPARALRTAGYGERYLKIPTAEAEAENRRVSVGRATDVIGAIE